MRSIFSLMFDSCRLGCISTISVGWSSNLVTLFRTSCSHYDWRWLSDLVCFMVDYCSKKRCRSLSCCRISFWCDLNFERRFSMLSDLADGLSKLSIRGNGFEFLSDTSFLRNKSVSCFSRLSRFCCISSKRFSFIWRLSSRWLDRSRVVSCCSSKVSKWLKVYL